jgi:hypothetical protein
MKELKEHFATIIETVILNNKQPYVYDIQDFCYNISFNLHEKAIKIVIKKYELTKYLDSTIEDKDKFNKKFIKFIKEVNVNHSSLLKTIPPTLILHFPK